MTDMTAPANSTPSGAAGDQRVAVLSRDLMFGSRIRASLRPIGYDVTIVNDVLALVELLESKNPVSSLGIVDFNFPVDWGDVKGAVETGVPILAFGPHTDVDAFRSAKAAGVARVVSNGEFSRTLPELARRYTRAKE